ncbi:KGGVGR-motif variant AAA ATPase [uncultured Deefgea sp.]|uniref:KGGVGR-motif variant AAA ATPase n=1 Tax=uncultured Deefgea sp. TaxID=1304914 RepID=UPI00262D349F|nr:AAA family ATPase [uncultured Deefgea sp.]
MTVYFDDSLRVFVALVQEEWGASFISNNLFLRDINGRLTFIILNNSKDSAERISLAAKAEAILGSYVDSDGFSVATPEELFDDRLNIDAALKVKLTIAQNEVEVNLIDRRMVGADWLRAPAPSARNPLRFVFASIKGGVGRSTALCVLAAHLAANGLRVLTVDMDLEAPGLGNLLLPEGTLPKFGLLDYLVEQGINPELEDSFFSDMIASSWLGGGVGRVDVIPAIGQLSLENPENVLAKIARAYMDGGINENSNVAYSFSDHISKLIDIFAKPYDYDVVLVDARAGLHETSAAAIIGLGAEILFFGVDQPQTFSGYELLFAHLANLNIDDNDDWRNRIRFIHAKALADSRKRSEFIQKIEQLAERTIYPQVASSVIVDLNSLSSSFEVEWDENSDISESVINDLNSISVIAIANDDRFNTFDPIVDRDSLGESVYQATYGDFVSEIMNSIALNRMGN